MSSRWRPSGGGQNPANGHCLNLVVGRRESLGETYYVGYR